ncbi:ATP-binding protein [Streptomyces sp. NPDC097619]|uniref:ATP-binding protein n=1 Tax=Streptomyces sp. NPDC097619 TaxID=3157228 RepID=UPI0033320B6E
MEGSTAPDGTSALPGAGIGCGQARDLARRLLERLRVPPERIADVDTVVTELVSNADRHAGGVTGFSVVPRPGVVLIAVSDASPRLPQQRPWAPAEPGGFGWLLINRLARTDVHHTPHGKTITARIPTTETAGP